MTLTKLFKLPTQSKNADHMLNATKLTEYQQLHHQVTHYILDEFSLIGCRDFDTINKRLNQIFLDDHENEDYMFGKRNMLLFGDMTPTAMKIRIIKWSQVNFA